MLTQVLFLVVLGSIQTPALDEQAISRRLEAYSHVERLAVATVDSMNCKSLGYEVPDGQPMVRSVMGLWEQSFRPDGVDFEAYLTRYNAQVDRLNTEFDEETLHAESSREALTMFRRNLTKRCNALAFDRPDWLKRTDTTMITSMSAWDAIEEELFGTEDEDAAADNRQPPGTE